MWHHEAIVPYDLRQGMRPLPQFPQLRQIRASRSNTHGADLRKNEMLHVGSLRAVQPLCQIAFSKPPLPSNFDCGNFPAFGPKANGTGRNTKPFRNSSRRKQRFSVHYFFHMNEGLLPL